MFRFDNGHVDFKSRYVKHRALQAAGRTSPRAFRPLSQPLHARSHRQGLQSGHGQHQCRVARRQAARAQRRRHAVRARSLHARDHRPVRLQRRVKSVWLSAHPHLDQTTNELLTFAYQAKGDGTTDVAYFVIGPDGKVKHEVWFNAPWAGMVHDFAISDKYVIFPFFPLLTDVDVLKKGGPFYTWHRDRPDGRRRRPALRHGGPGPLVPRPHELCRAHDERLDGRLEGQPRRLPLTRQLVLLLPESRRHAA